MEAPEEMLEAEWKFCSGGQSPKVNFGKPWKFKFSCRDNGK